MEMQHPKIKKHPWPLLVVALLLIGLLTYLIIFFPPAYIISIATLKIPLVVAFLLVVFVTIYALMAYLTINSWQGLIFGVAGVVYLLLRYFGISHPLFGILLLAMLVSIEFAIYKKK